MTAPGVRGLRVVIVEDHVLLAQSLRVALDGAGLVASAPPIDLTAIGALAREDPPDVLLLDLELGGPRGPGREEGAPAVDGTVLIAPFVAAGTRVVVVTGSVDRERHARCVELGAAGVLSKTASLGALVDAVRAAAAGTALLSVEERRRLLDEAARTRADRTARLAPFAALSPRERAVLGSVVAGRGAAEIAVREHVTEATVRSQIRAVLTKLGVHSQLAAAARAHRAGWTYEGGAATR